MSWSNMKLFSSWEDNLPHLSIYLSIYQSTHAIISHHQNDTFLVIFQCCDWRNWWGHRLHSGFRKHQSWASQLRRPLTAPHINLSAPPLHDSWCFSWSSSLGLQHPISLLKFVPLWDVWGPCCLHCGAQSVWWFQPWHRSGEEL